MARSFSEALTQAWYSRAIWPRILFFPLSILFALIAQIRRFALSKNQTSSVPLIVVGNISVGGTGKSPLVSYLVRHFEGLGLKVGIVSRGYGVSIPKHEVRLVELNSPADQVGDEPLMLKRMLKCPIALSPNRVLAVRKLVSLGLDLVISDDGLQHYAMARDIELCVVDGARGIGNGCLLPSGPLREPASRLNSVDAIIINGKLTQPLPVSDSVFMTSMVLKPVEFVNVATEQRLSISEFVANYQHQALHACAGIGNPKRFFETLKDMGLVVQPHAFPDHYKFSSIDFAAMEGVIVMTEKDASKCRGFELEQAWYLKVEPELHDKLGDRLYNSLIEKRRLTVRPELHSAGGGK